MKKQDWPEWLLNLSLRFREDDDDKDDDEGDEADEAEDEEDDESEEEDDKDKSEDDKDKSKKSKKGQADDDLAELKKALRDERQKRRKAEREARQAKTATADKEDKENAEEAAQKLQAAEEKTKRLATRLRKTEVERAVIEAATKAGYIDPTDALTDAVLREIDVDQDEDDPSDIEVDLDSVTDAVKDYAAKKKHLIGQGTPGSRSGSKLKKKKGDSGKLTDQKLQATYPSLQ